MLGVCYLRLWFYILEFHATIDLHLGLSHIHRYFYPRHLLSSGFVSISHPLQMGFSF